MAHEEIYLRGILATVGRQAFPPERLAELVSLKGSGEKQLSAYNLCDGSRTQSEIAKLTSFDTGNFSKLVQRWCDCGIIVKLGDGKPLHIYPLPSSGAGKSKNKGEQDE